MTTRLVLRSTAITDQVASADEGSASSATSTRTVRRMAVDCILPPEITHMANRYSKIAQVKPSRYTIVTLLFAIVLVAAASAQEKNPRLGKWKLKSDAPPPAI